MGYTINGQGPSAGASLSDATPQPTGTAAAGVSTSAARADHVHAASVAAADISDAGATGIALVQASTAAAAQSALGLGALATLDSNDRVRLLLTEASGSLANSGGAGGTWTAGSGLLYQQAPMLSGGVRYGSGINGASGSNAVEPTSLSLWAWIRMRGLPGSDAIILGKPHPASTSPTWADPYWSVRLGANGSSLIASVVRSGAVSWASRQEISAARLAVGRDTLVGLTYVTTTGVLSLWIDGELVTSNTTAGSIAYGTPAATPWVSGYVWSGSGDRPDAIVHALGVCDTARPASWWQEMHRRGRGTWR